MKDDGFFSRRLKLLRSKHAKIEKEFILDNVPQIDTTTSPEEDLEFLKTAVIGSLSREIITSKLNSTRELRKQLMSVEKTDVRCHFPFIFSNPHIVSVCNNIIM